MDLGPLAFDTMFDALCEQHAKRAVRIHHVAAVADANGHLFAISRGDALQRGGGIEGAGADLADPELDAYAPGFEIDDAAGPIRSLVVLEAALQPETSICATDGRTGRVDTAAPGAALMDAVATGGFGEFIDAQDRAAMRAAAAASFRGTALSLWVASESRQDRTQALISLAPPVVHIDAVSSRLGVSLRDSICSKMRS